MRKHPRLKLTGKTSRTYLQYLAPGTGRYRFGLLEYLRTAGSALATYARRMQIAEGLD